jgi:nitrite reductase/ring-hydroxylating ferredoxin subunit/uncharacterized membrane protein
VIETRLAEGARRLVDRLERLEALDAVGEHAQRLLAGAARRYPGAKDVLSGTWLGHPLHPPLTDVVVGAWTGALVLDVCGGERGRDAADLLVATGVVASVPTAAAGLSDWADLSGPTRRLGSVHALGNLTAVAAQAASLAARREGRRGRGIALSLGAYAVVTSSAWLGGHLAWAKGVGVNPAPFERFPSEWTPTVNERELAAGALVGVEAGAASVLLVRAEGAIHALANRCSHRGCPLSEGELVGDTIVCRCHGSAFRLDGSVARGPATFPQTALEARVQDGTVEVRTPPEPR